MPIRDVQQPTPVTGATSLSADPFASNPHDGECVCVFVITVSDSADDPVHLAPTDSAGNTYLQAGALYPNLDEGGGVHRRMSCWVCDGPGGFVGDADLVVTAHLDHVTGVVTLALIAYALQSVSGYDGYAAEAVDAVGGSSDLVLTSATSSAVGSLYLGCVASATIVQSDSLISPPGTFPGYSDPLAMHFTDAGAGPYLGLLTYFPPGGTSLVDPAEGGTLGGDPVTITGGPFVSGDTVTFDAVDATEVVVVDASTITCVTPAHAGEGLIDVVVTHVDTTTIATEGFTYQVSASTPIVHAGPAQVAEGPLPSVVTTAATVERGANNGTLTYLWSQISGPAEATISDPTMLTTDLTFDTFVPGIYIFQLAVTTEGAVFTATGTCTVIMGPTIPPRVTGGRRQVVV